MTLDECGKDYKMADYMARATADAQAQALACGCSKERARKALMSISREDLREMIEDGKSIEMNCHFCNTSYSFSIEELLEMYAGGQ